jgi:N-acetyl-beta-hexosaminidase
VPGHSTACVRALPGLFGFPSAPTLGIVNFVNASVVARLQTIFTEIDDVFHSPFVSIGGDEVDFGALQDLPEIKAALKAQQLDSVSDLYRQFIAEMQRFAVARNKTLRVWEGFGPRTGQTGHKPVDASVVTIPTEGISVSVFDGCYYNPPRLAGDGYRVINSNTAVLYINEPTSVPEMIYSWHPWLFGDLAYAGYESWWELESDQQRAQVDGVQICAWGMSSEAMLDGMRSKAPAMSDRSWHPQAMRTYADFQTRVAATDAKLQLLLVSPTPPSPPGPPSPPPPPPGPPGTYSPERGACRDARPSDTYSSPRIETKNIPFSECRAKCEQVKTTCTKMNFFPATIITSRPDSSSLCVLWRLLLNLSLQP